MTSSSVRRTLAIDVGGTGLKACLLDNAATIVGERVRIPTRYPMSPDSLVSNLVSLAGALPRFHRASVGFPGVVREGRVLTAPHFVNKNGPDDAPNRKLTAAWRGFDLSGALTGAFGVPVRIANDADLQGAAAVSGAGIEMVMTLGTGVGTGLFRDGRVAPHLELGHHPLEKGKTYDQRLGEGARRRVGTKKWQERVYSSIAVLDALVNFDHLYVGGGNARRLELPLPERVTVVSNEDGLLGAVKLWDNRTFR